MDRLQLTGQTRSHVIQYQNPRFAVQKVVGEAFGKMRDEAAKCGIEINPVSSFRDFGSQLKIWNRKFLGKSPLYDRNGKMVDSSRLAKREIVTHILAWSALPGASRHHWGTEIDVVDGGAVKPGFVVRLLPEECEKGAPFYPMHCWLNENMQRFGFYRPYRGKKSGVAFEPWHISYGKISSQALSELTLEMLYRVVEESEMAGRELVTDMLPTIYREYVKNVEPFDDLL